MLLVLLILADSNGSVSLLTTLGNLRFSVGGDAGTPGNNSINALQIKNNGDVGIGTDNPQYKLEVAGDIKLGELGTLWFSDEPLSVEKIVATTSTLDYYSDSLHKFYESDANVERATFNVNSTSGRLYFDGDSDTYFTREAANSHVFVNAGSESLRINASGNVGIGTNNPQDRLDIAGNAIPNIDVTYNLGSPTIDGLMFMQTNLMVLS